MKKIGILFITFIAIGCSQKKEKNESWKELDAFHDIMAKAFHPLKDSGNVAPAKMLITDLANQAAAWSSSSIPERINTPEVKSLLNDLKTQSQALSDSVKKGASDEYVKTKMEGLHSQFHQIMEAWTGHHGEGEHHREGKHHNDGEDDDDDDEDED